jgi:SAM-dependent methyltransferase
MRFLRPAFPQTELVACDLNRDGVDFCARTFGAVPEYSHENVDQIPHEGVVDLIWCGSLLTHLSEAQCHAFLRFFHRILGHRGILLFTMHGRSCARELTAPHNRYGITQAQGNVLLHDYRRNGFGFAAYDAQTDYGISLAHPSFVTTHLLDETNWKLLGYHETGWGQHQDVIAVQKVGIT